MSTKLLSEKLVVALQNKNYIEAENYINQGADVNLTVTQQPENEYCNPKVGVPLYYAVSNRSTVRILNLLLEKGADATVIDNYYGETLLHIAVERDFEEIVKVLLQSVCLNKLKEFVNAKTPEEGNTALHIAAVNRSLEITNFLLKHGAVYNPRNEKGKTPLDLSMNQRVTNMLELIEELFDDAAKGNMKMIDKLKTANPYYLASITNARNDQEKSMLQTLIINQHKDLANILTNFLKNLDQISFSTPECKVTQLKKLKYLAEVHIESSELMYLNKLKDLLRHNSLHSSNFESENYSDLWVAVKEGSFYLRNAYNLVQAYKECRTGVIDGEDVEEVNNMLLELEFDPEHISSGFSDEFKNKTLVVFVSKGQGAKYYKLLHNELSLNTFVNMVKTRIDTPVKRFLDTVKQNLMSVLVEWLFASIENNNHLDVENCINELVDINLRNLEGKTPLHYAIEHGNIDIVKLLMKHKADITLVSNKGETPLHIAVLNDCKEITEMLLQNIHSDNLSDIINSKVTVGGNTLLHIAAEDSSLDILTLLLKHGAIFNIQNDQGQTPLNLSKCQKITSLLSLIEELFEDAKIGSLEFLSKLKEAKLKDVESIMNTSNKQGETMDQIVVLTEHQDYVKSLAKMLKEIEQNKYLSKIPVDEITVESLKGAAKLYIRFSHTYLNMLMYPSYALERNNNGWKALKEGSYCLGNAANLVKLYKNCFPGPISNKDIQIVSDTLTSFEFKSEYRSVGYTYEAYGGKTNVFVSEGRGTKFFHLLHGESIEGVKLFTTLVKRYVDNPVNSFLKSV